VPKNHTAASILNDRSDAGRSTLALHERNIAAEHHNTLWDEKLPAHMRLALGLDNLKPVEVPVDDAFLRFYMTLLASKLSDRVAPRGAN
jgi:hypothetical protein